MKKILYIHGLGSTRNGNSATELKKMLAGYQVDSFDVPLKPLEAVKCIEELSEGYDLLIGSSMGGYYAQSGREGIPRILVNPALKAAENLRSHIGYGTFEYYGPREDGINCYTLDEAYYEELSETERSLSLEGKREETYLIFGTEDELLGTDNHQIAMDSYGKDKITWVRMGHQIAKECLEGVIVPMVKRILER